MDAKHVIREALILGVPSSPTTKADLVLAALAKANIDLVHRDENHGPTLERAAGADDAETKMAVAALVALAERGIPTDVQELLVRGDPMRGIAPGALSAAFAAAIRAMGEKK